MYERMGFVRFGAGLDLGAQLAPRARLEPVDGEPGVAPAVQAPHAVADRLEHPLHLAVAALVDRQLDAAAAETAHARRAGRPSSSSTPSRSAREVGAVGCALHSTS